MNKSKVLHIGYSGVSGATYLGFCLIEGDIKKEWQNHFCFIGIEDLAQSNREKCEELSIPYNLLLKKRGLSFKSWVEFMALFRTLSPDVVISYGTTELFIPLIYLTLFSKTKIIIAEQTPINLKTRSEWLMSNLGMLISFKIILVNEDYKHKLRSKLAVFREDKIEIIPNAVNLTQFHPELQSVKTDEIIRFAMVSRLDSEKDYFTVLQAIKKLVSDGFSNLHFKIIGGGPFYNDIEKAVNDLELTPYVKLLGRIPLTQVAEELRSLHFYVHSAKGETMSLSIMQAMATGLPTAATNVEGISTNLSHNVDSILFEFQNIEQCYVALKQLITDKRLRESLGKEALNKAKNKYSHITYFNKFNALVNTHLLS